MAAIFINLEVRAPTRLPRAAPASEPRHCTVPRAPESCVPARRSAGPGWRVFSRPPGGRRAARSSLWGLWIEGTKGTWCPCWWVWPRRTHPGGAVGFVAGGKRVPCPSEQSRSPALQTPGRGHRKAIPVGSHRDVASRAGCGSDTRQASFPRPVAAGCCRPSPQPSPQGRVPLTQSHPAKSGGQHEWLGTDREPGWGMWGARCPACQSPPALSCEEHPSPARGPSPQQRGLIPHGPGPQAADVPFGHQSLPGVGRLCRGGRGLWMLPTDHALWRLRAVDTLASAWERPAGTPAPHAKRLDEARSSSPPAPRSRSCARLCPPGPDQGAPQLSAGRGRGHDGGGQRPGQGLPGLQGEVRGGPPVCRASPGAGQSGGRLRPGRVRGGPHCAECKAGGRVPRPPLQ